MKISLLQGQAAEYDAVLEQKYQVGKIDGKKEEKLEIAKNLLGIDMDKIAISKATGLNLDEIEAIKFELVFSGKVNLEI
jgi:hypothetical protein